MFTKLCAGLSKLCLMLAVIGLIEQGAALAQASAG
mgnify:CR=1 FL=1